MQQQICALSNQPIFRDGMLVKFGDRSLSVSRARFLAKVGPMLLRLVPQPNGQKPLRLWQVPGVDGKIPGIGQVSAKVDSFNIDGFLTLAERKTNDDVALRRWSRQVVAGLSMFGPEVCNYAANKLGIDANSITEAERVYAQTGRELVMVTLQRRCASTIDPNADRFKPHNPYRMKHALPRR